MEYKGVILTNHILARMKERNISYDDIYWVFSKPDEIKDGKTKLSKKFYRNYKRERWSIVAKKNESGQWVLLTCWIKDLENEKDSRIHGNDTEKRNRFWENLWGMIRGKK